MKKALNDKQKIVAYLLNKDPDLGNVSTKKIGETFKVAQSTAYNAVKDIAIAKRIYDLEKKLEETKMEILTYQDPNDPELIHIARRIPKWEDEN